MASNSSWGRIIFILAILLGLGLAVVPVVHSSTATFTGLVTTKTVADTKATRIPVDLGNVLNTKPNWLTRIPLARSFLGSPTSVHTVSNSSPSRHPYFLAPSVPNSTESGSATVSARSDPAMAVTEKTLTYVLRGIVRSVVVNRTQLYTNGPPRADAEVVSMAQTLAGTGIGTGVRHKATGAVRIHAPHVTGGSGNLTMKGAHAAPGNLSHIAVSANSTRYLAKAHLGNHTAATGT